MISVIVPIYNVESYLNECIDSISSQSYRDLEIILVDDGSTDKSPILCDEWAKRDARIRVIHKTNGGLSDARNAGIDIAQGKYITFVDSDDVIQSDMIEYLVNLLISVDADISVCQRSLIDEYGNTISSLQSSKSVRTVRGSYECMSEYLSSNDIDTVAWGKLYKTSLFKNVRYPKGKFHEDVFTTYKLIAQCESIAIGSERKYLYRVRKGSITQISFTEKHMDAILGKEEQADFIKHKFPKLYPLAKGEIIYACNQCLLRLAKSSANATSFINDFKRRYRRYAKFYLSGDYRAMGKLFTILSWISPRLTIGSIRFLRKIIG